MAREVGRWCCKEGGKKGSRVRGVERKKKKGRGKIIKARRNGG